ncbi:MAG: hypothetical protein ACOYUZ_05030 [Patescibacteria group bacterium]
MTTTKDDRERINIRFDTAVEVGDKAVEMGLDDFENCAYRNLQAAVQIVCPAELLEAGKVELPARLDHHVGECSVIVDYDVYQQVVAEPVGAVAEKLANILYQQRADGRVALRISLPPPVPATELTISMPARGSGQRWGNNLISVHTSLDLFVRLPKSGKQGGGQPQFPGHPSFLQADQVNYWMLHPENPEELEERGELRVYSGQWPWMKRTQLNCLLHDDFEVKPEDFEEKCAFYLEGMHEDVRNAVKEGRVRLFLLPRYHVQPTRSKFFTRYFPNYARALRDHDNYEISSKRNHIEPNTDTEFHFHGFTGVKDPRRNKFDLTGFFFGMYPPLFTGRKTESGEQEICRSTGIIVLMDIETFRGMMAAFYEFYASGRMLGECRYNCLRIGDEAFAGDDARGDSEPPPRRKRRKGNDKPKPKSAPPDEPKPASEPPDEPEPEPEPTTEAVSEPPPAEAAPEPEPDFAGMGIDPADDDSVPGDDDLPGDEDSDDTADDAGDSEKSE